MAQVVPDPLLAIIRARNAARIGRRSAVAALAQSVGRAGFSSFTREGATPRQIGGRFEELEAEPAPQELQEPGQLPQDVVDQIFKMFRFQGSEQVVPRQTRVEFAQGGPNRFLSRFQGGGRQAAFSPTGFVQGGAAGFGSRFFGRTPVFNTQFFGQSPIGFAQGAFVR